MGSILGAAGQRDRILRGFLQRLRAPGKRDVARHPAGRGHWSAREALVARSDGGVVPPLHGYGRTQCADRGGSLYRLAGTGASLQAGTVGNPEAARGGETETRG